MAAVKAQIVYEELPAILDIDSALTQNSLLRAPQTDSNRRCRCRISGRSPSYAGADGDRRPGTFLSGRAGSHCRTRRSRGTKLNVSTQHPTEIQHKVAEALGRLFHQITVQVRRMGGAFGGKESQANLPAIIAALAAVKTGKPPSWSMTVMRICGLPANAMISKFPMMWVLIMKGLFTLWMSIRPCDAVCPLIYRQPLQTGR